MDETQEELKPLTTVRYRTLTATILQSVLPELFHNSNDKKGMLL